MSDVFKCVDLTIYDDKIYDDEYEYTDKKGNRVVSNCFPEGFKPKTIKVDLRKEKEAEKSNKKGR